MIQLKDLFKYLVFIQIFICVQLFAAQKATVITSKAIIYADKELTSAIGYVTRGAQVLVGNVKRKKKTILPIALNGSIAWIKIENLSLNGEQKSLENNHNRVTEHQIESWLASKEGNDDPLDQNNFLLLKTGALNSVELKNESSNIASSSYEFAQEDKSGNNISLLFEHRNPNDSWAWGIGLDYFKILSETANYKAIAFKGNIAWLAINNSIISIEIFGGLLFTSDFHVELQDLGTYKGLMWGLDYGVMARFFPQYKFGLAVGLNAFYMNLVQLDNLENSFADNKTNLTALSAAQLFAGLTYRF